MPHSALPRKNIRSPEPDEEVNQTIGGHPASPEEENKTLRMEIADLRQRITEYTKLEEELRESEAKYRILFDSMSEGYTLSDLIVDSDGRPVDYIALDVNPVVEKILGLPRNKIIGHHISEIFPQMRPPLTRLGEMIRTGTPIHFEEYSPTLKKWFDVNAFPVPPGNRFAQILSDISERKRAEEALRESEEKYRNLVEESLQSLVIIQDGRIVFANRQAVEFAGYTEAELLSLPPEGVFGLLHPDDRSLIAQRMHDRLAGNNVPSRYEVRFLRKDGTMLWVGAYVSLLQYRGRVAHQITFIDITDRRQAEEALQRSEEKYRNLVEQAPDAILIHTEGKIQYVNPAALVLLDASRPDELVGRDIMSIVPPAYQDWLRSTITKDYENFERGNAPVIEIPLIRRDGSIVWTDGRSTRTYIDDKPAFQVFIRDISERKRTELELTEYAENLKRSNDDLERFAYVSSHDLKEPIRAIVSFSQILQMEYGKRLDEKGDRYLKNIIEAGNRMNALVEDLLEYARLSRQEIMQEQTSSESVLEETLALFSSRCKTDGVVISHDPLPPVRMDHLLLRIVFQNLIGNALKFRNEDTPPRIHISAQPVNGMIRFSVSDNGIGIKPEYLQKIFVIFERLHRRDQYDGTGIGLALVKRIVERHGGTIWAESEPGKGSTFYFTVPAATEV